MHYFTFADKDSTLYEVSSSMNSGLDEILEVRKDVSDTGIFVDSSRELIFLSPNLNIIMSLLSPASYALENSLTWVIDTFLFFILNVIPE